MHDSVQRASSDAVCMRALNIASSEYRTDDIDFGRAYRSCGLSRIPSSRPAHTLGRRMVMKKFLRPLSSFRRFKKGQLSVTGERMCTNDTGKLPRRLAREQCG